MVSVPVFLAGLVLGLVAALIKGHYDVRARQRAFVNDYYKVIVSKRLEAYECLNALVGPVKVAVLDKAMWLSDEAFEKARELNKALFYCDYDDPPAFGKERYEEIAAIRAGMERVIAEDLLELHDVRKFLGKKRDTDFGFSPFP